MKYWKLEMEGLGDKTCKLLKNYLTNRKQVTKMGNITSDLESVTTGFPTGVWDH